MTRTLTPRPAQRQFRSGRILWLAAAIAGIATSARAIDIVLNFDSAKSVLPTSDPTASGLIGLFQFAESFYEYVFLDNHTLTLNFWYENLPTGTLGSHALVSQSGGREIEGHIRIDSDSNWFIDATPQSNEEFSVHTGYWDSLSSSSRSDWFRIALETIPANFEVAHGGAAHNGRPAHNRLDMLSVVLHEVGHALGMAASNTATQAETTDLDYDFNPNWVNGATLAARTSGSDIAHLANSSALMTTTLPISRRRLPSHTDLFAMAAASSLTMLNVPRPTFYGGGNWNDPLAWPGGRLPESDDVVDLGGANVELTGPASAGTLTIGPDATLRTNGHPLSVISQLNLGGHVEIGPDGALFGGNVIMDRNFPPLEPPSIVVRGGTLAVDALDAIWGGRLEFEPGSTLRANRVLSSTFVMQDGTAHIAVSFSSADARFAGTNDVYIDLAFNHTNAKVMDDGNVTFWCSPSALLSIHGTFDATDGDISVMGGVALFPQRGTLLVGPGHTIHIEAPWTHRGPLNLSGGVDLPSRAALTGGMITYDSDLSTLNASGRAVIDAPLAMSAGRVDVAAGGRLDLNRATAITGGSLNVGSGAVLVFNQEGKIGAAAAFSGTGAVINADDSTLDLAHGATVGVAVQNAGDLKLGASAGSATVDALIQSAAGFLHIELGGYTPGTRHDHLQVVSIAELGGLLRISLIDGFVPIYGDRFEIMSYGSVSGSFSGIELGAPWSGVSFVAEYGPTVLTITAVPDPMIASPWLIGLLSLPRRRHR